MSECLGMRVCRPLNEDYFPITHVLWVREVLQHRTQNMQLNPSLLVRDNAKVWWDA